MKKTLLMMTLLAGLMLVSSCASKKELEECRQRGLGMMQSYKELNISYQDAKEQLAAANVRVTSLEEQLAESKAAYERLQQSLDKSLVNSSQSNVSIEKLVDQINESNQYIRHLTDLKTKSDSLNLALTNNCRYGPPGALPAVFYLHF